MRRPLIPVLLAYLSGIFLESQWNLATHLNLHQNSMSYMFILGYGVLLCLWALLFRLNYTQLATGVLILLALVIGMSRYARHTSVPPHHISHFVTDKVVTIEGMLYKPPESSGAIFYDNVEPNRYLYISAAWLEQGSVRHQVCGNVRITLIGSALLQSERKSFVYGDTIRTRLRLHLPQNFDDFDYREYLRRRKIYLIGTVKHDRYIIMLPEQRGNPLLNVIYRIRRHILHVIDTLLSSQQQDAAAIQIIKAMTLGTNRELSPEVREYFRNAGMYHFLVVSGIHIGILAGVLHYVFRMFYVPLRYRSFFILPILLGYAGVTGFQYPVLRALIMASVLYFAITYSRVTDSVYSLLFSVGVMVFLSPIALFEVSFQLTVAATISILLCYNRFSRVSWWIRISRMHLFVRIPIITMLISCSAMLGIAPLLLFYFRQISPYSIFSNVLVFPIITVLVPFSLCVEGLSLIFPTSMLAPLLMVNVMLAKLLYWIARCFPPFNVNIPQLSLLFLMIYYGVGYSGLVFWKTKR